jgi:hypothetical protein
MGQGPVGLTALYKTADAQNDLPGSMGLAGSFVQSREQFFWLDLLRVDSRDHAAAVIADGCQRLVQLMGHTRGHLTHGDEAAGRLGALSLLRGQFLGLSSGRDVTGDHHLRQSTISPVDVARTHLQPLAKF